MEKYKILIVDDEWNMRNLLSILLAKDFSIVEASCGRDALVLLDNEDIDLMILDIMMPDMNGWELCRKVRERNNIPILMLSALGDIDNKVQGFEIGADDYLVKPFQPEELVVRLKALVRRLLSEKLDKSIFVLRDLKIDVHGRQVYINDTIIDLTPKEFNLLLLLVENPKKVFTRDMLLDQVWGIYNVLDMRTVDSHVKNLREKFRKHSLSFNPIKTVWGVGYKFEHPENENEVE